MYMDETLVPKKLATLAKGKGCRKEARNTGKGNRLPQNVGNNYETQKAAAKKSLSLVKESAAGKGISKATKNKRLLKMSEATVYEVIAQKMTEINVKDTLRAAGTHAPKTQMTSRMMTTTARALLPWMLLALTSVSHCKRKSKLIQSSHRSPYNRTNWRLTSQRSC